MKKIAILTSILALAACGGGSGGGGSTGGGRSTYDPARALVPDSIHSSNHRVTSMASRILIARDGSNRTISRSSVVPFEGQEFDSYDLTDVSFNFSDEGFGGLVSFGIDENKKITHFNMYDDETGLVIDNHKVYQEADSGEVYVDGDGNMQTQNGGGGNFSDPDSDGVVTYTSNNPGAGGRFKVINGELYSPYDGDEFSYNETTGKMESSDPAFQINDDGTIYAIDTFQRTGDDTFTFSGMITVDGGVQVPGTLTYNSGGKTITGLRYSDFGYFQLSSDDDIDRPVSVIGGYDIKKIAHEDLPNSEMVFSGTAVGSVVAIRDGNVDIVELNSDNSELKFADGTSTLTAGFNNWYDIKFSETYDNEGNATNKKLAVYNYNDSPFHIYDEDGNIIDTRSNYFRMLNDTYDAMAEQYASEERDGQGNLIGLVKNNVENTEQHGSNIDHFDSINSDLRFFGDDGVPSEMVGLIQIRDCAGNQCGEVDDIQHDEIRMNLGFGGIK